jgi:flagellar motility protein MotE (MotC chaperone)
MIKLPAARLLPVTIVVTAILLALKSLSLGQAALASDPSEGPGLPKSMPVVTRQSAQTPPIVIQPPAPKPEPTPATPFDWTLLQDLKARRLAIESREHALDTRASAIDAAARDVETKLAALSAMQSRLEALETVRKQRTEAGWTGLVKLYEAMRPADAAGIFDALDTHVLLQILDRMNERKAALVMGNMQPERARLATQMLALYRQRENADPASVQAPSQAMMAPTAG